MKKTPSNGSSALSEFSDCTDDSFVDVTSGIPEFDVASALNEGKNIARSEKIRGTPATEVKRKWRSEQINAQCKFANSIDSSWRQLQIVSWSGIVHKKCSTIFGATWQPRRFELRQEQKFDAYSGKLSQRPILHYFTRTDDDVIEKSMVILDIRKEPSVMLNGGSRACLSLKVAGRKSRLRLVTDFTREALLFAFHVKAMLEPGRFDRDEYISDDEAIRFPERTLSNLMSQR